MWLRHIYHPNDYLSLFGFTYLKVADIVTFTESANDGHPDYNLTQVLYGFNKTASADLLAAIGLADGAGRYENADNTDKLDSDNYYYTSNTLNKALAGALAANSTTVKDALETYITANGGAEMALTDANGSTSASDLPVGLYLLVETKVPEMVTSTVNPFFISLPMTTVTGDENSASQDGGKRWNYDVVVYPKNETGIPTLEKTVRESAADTGKNSGTNGITDGYAHNATASTGDTLEYQIISTLPTITSKATALSVYNFYDSLSEGMEYSKEAGIKLEFFKDKDCTDSAASWDMESGKFTVTYSEDNRHMTVDITQAGLDEINGSASNANGAIYAGYSNYTLRITYTAAVNSDDSFVCGDHEKHQIHPGCSRRHVMDKFFMAGDVNKSRPVSVSQFKRSKTQIRCNSPAFLLRQTVCILPGKRPDQSRFPMVDMSCRTDNKMSHNLFPFF